MTHRMLRAASLTLLTAILAPSCGQVAEQAGSPSPVVTVLADGNQTLSGPYTHGNLAIFLVHGPDQIASDREMLTLQEALEQKLVVVHETGTVSELAIENLSDDIDVFVQSGDIVQGGKQDRTITTDLVLTPKSGKVPLGSFCVEAGRWTGRAGGEVELFESSTNALSTLDLKRAVKAASQSAVWEEVAETQSRLEESLGFAGIRVAGYASSLEMTLGGDKVRDSTEPYIQALEGILAGKDNVVGFSFAINGNLNSAEVYGSQALFARLWPKLLRASSVEALAEGSVEGDSVTAAEVAEFLEVSSHAEPTTRGVGETMQIIQVENPDNDLYETRYLGSQSWIHRSYLARR